MTSYRSIATSVALFALFVCRTSLAESAAPASGLSAPAATAPSEAGKPAAPGEKATSTGWFTLPKMSMPKFNLPKIEMSKMANSAIGPLKSSARKISDGSKKAWEGTKEIFHVGPSSEAQPAARVASRPEPSLWKKMFGGAPPADEGPQTIGEFMSGTRLK